MYKVGVFPGKFLPPHRGHLNAIIQAATQCERLYVVVSDNSRQNRRICYEDGIPFTDMRLRAKWLSIELQGFDHIKVIMLDETDIPEYPAGWAPWAKRLNMVVGPFDVLFGGEREYKEVNEKYFPGKPYILYDYARSIYPISATEIRKHPIQNWDYILGSARGFFTKKVLITGTESCGKTTLTKYLAKLYYTSWSEEVGRYYSARYLGGNEDIFTPDDFTKIARLQSESDEEAYRTSNRVAFIDTDAVVTQFYSKMYLKHQTLGIEDWIRKEQFDLILLFKPTVPWVADGLRWNEDQEKREHLHQELKEMYQHYEYQNSTFRNVVEIGGNYQERLSESIKLVDKLLGK